MCYNWTKHGQELERAAPPTHFDALAVVVDVRVDEDLDFGEGAAWGAEVAGEDPGARVVDPIAQAPLLQ